MSDLAGNDISWHIRKRHYDEQPKRSICASPTRSASSAVSARRPTRAGIDYEPGDRTPIPIPVVDEMIARTAKTIGIAAARDRRRGNRRSAGLLARQRRREDSRRRHRAARFGHRRRVPDGLRLSDPPRRADVLCRDGQPVRGRAAHAAIRAQSARRSGVLDTGAAARRLAAEGGSFNAPAGGAR